MLIPGCFKLVRLRYVNRFSWKRVTMPRFSDGLFFIKQIFLTLLLTLGLHIFAFHLAAMANSSEHLCQFILQGESEATEFIRTLQSQGAFPKTYEIVNAETGQPQTMTRDWNPEEIATVSFDVSNRRPHDPVIVRITSSAFIADESKFAKKEPFGELRIYPRRNLLYGFGTQGREHRQRMETLQFQFASREFNMEQYYLENLELVRIDFERDLKIVGIKDIDTVIGRDETGFPRIYYVIRDNLNSEKAQEVVATVLTLYEGYIRPEQDTTTE